MAVRLVDDPTPAPVAPWAESIEALPGDWSVWRVVSTTEKRIARYLTEKRIGYCLPLQSRETCSGGKRRTSVLPLMPGYIFVASGHDGKGIMIDYRRMHSRQVFDHVNIFARDQFVRQMSGLLSRVSEDPYLAVHCGIHRGAYCKIRPGEHPIQKRFEGLPAYVEEVGPRMVLSLRLTIMNASFVVGDVTADMIDLEEP